MAPERSGRPGASTEPEEAAYGCGHGFLTIQERYGQLQWVQSDGEVTAQRVSDASRLTYFGYDLDLWADDCRHCCTNLRIVLGDPSRKGFVGIIERSEDRPDAIEYRYVLAKPGNPPVYVPRDGEEAASFEEKQAWLVWEMMMLGEPGRSISGRSGVPTSSPPGA